MKRVRFWILAVSAFNCSSAYAQQVGSPPPTIDEILETTSSRESGAAWTPAVSSLIAPVTTNPTTVSGRIMLTPTPASNAILDLNGKKTTWGALTPQEIRGALDLQDENVEIEKYDFKGNLSSLPVNANFGKGSYRVTYYYYRFRNQTCFPDDPASGGVAVGIGIRVTAEIKTLKSGVAITGLLPLSAAAESQKVKGTLRIEAIGIASGTSSITSYLAGTSDVTPEGIRKAVESFGVVKAVAETPNVSLSPNYLFVQSDDVRACVNALKPG